jgi:hypothetical protein
MLNKDYFSALTFFPFFLCRFDFVKSVEVWGGRREPMKNGALECSVCHSKLVSPNSRTYSKAYDRHKNRVSSKQRALKVLLVVGDCVLVGLQVISCIHDSFLLIWVHLFIVNWDLSFNFYVELLNRALLINQVNISASVVAIVHSNVSCGIVLFYGCNSN